MRPLTLVLVLASPLFLPPMVRAQKPSGTGDDATKKPAEETVYKDKEFHFEWSVPPTLKYWHLDVPERKGNDRVVRMTHAIGGKKDRIIVTVQAVETTVMRRTLKELFEKVKFEVEGRFSEIVKNDSNEKDRFRGLPAISLKINGRTNDERKEIWDREAYLLEKSGTFYIIQIEAESGMIEKYKAELDEVKKSLKIR